MFKIQTRFELLAFVQAPEALALQMAAMLIGAMTVLVSIIQLLLILPEVTISIFIDRYPRVNLQVRRSISDIQQMDYAIVDYSIEYYMIIWISFIL